MLGEMQAVYEAELDQHLNILTGEQAELIKHALDQVTQSTCDSECESDQSDRVLTPGRRIR
jgi:hypothetical protein